MPARQGGIEIIDLLRTTMSVGIMVLHCRELFAPGSPVDLYTQRFHYFTDVFFIMSGYLLTLRPRRGPHGAFLLARLTRIYPLHLATFLFCAGLIAVKSLGRTATPFPFGTALSHLSLTHGLGLADRPYDFNGPSWSISALFVCYLLLPLLAKVLHRGPWLGAAAVAALFALAAAAADGQLSRAADAGAGILRCLPDFAFGLVLARTRLATRPSLPLMIALACALFTALPGEMPHDLVCMALVYLFFAAIHALHQSGFAPPDWTRPVSRLAPYTFSIFMLHFPVLRIAGNLMPRDYILAHPPVGAALTALVTVASLALAVVAHHRFEVPVAAWLNARLRALPAPRPSTRAEVAAGPAILRPAGSP